MVRHPALPASIGRELLEQGFEVAVVSDGTVAAQFPDLDGYQSAVTNFRFIAYEVLTTEESVERVRAAAAMAAR